MVNLRPTYNGLKGQQMQNNGPQSTTQLLKTKD